MKFKKVLVLTTSFPIKNLPVGMHVFNKCKYLAKKGVDLTVIAPHYPGEKYISYEKKFKIIRFPYFIPHKLQKVAYNAGILQNIKNSIFAKIQLPIFMLLFTIYGIIYGRKFDIIHAHWFPAGLVGVVIKKLLNKKLILMLHHPQKYNIIFKWILKNTNYLFTNSSYVMNETQKIYSIKNKKILPVPIEYSIFNPQKEVVDIRSNLFIKRDQIFVFSAGRLIAWKGFEYLIQAFNILVKKYKTYNIFLRIAGKGPKKSNYNSLINKLDLGKYVKLIGYVPNTEIHSYYTEADIFVIPSIIDDNGETEGFGVVSLEANACETPVIGSSVGGIVDVIEDGYNGFLVEQKNPKQIANKILQLAEDKELRNEMGINGRKKVLKDFNWDNIADEIIKVYSEII